MFSRVIKNLVNRRTAAFLNYNKLSVSDFLFTNGCQPLFFRPSNVVSMDGLQYCSGLFFKPVNFKDDDIGVAIHIESLETPIDSYMIPHFARLVSEKTNYDNIEAIIVSRTYLTGTTFRSLSDYNASLIKDLISSYCSDVTIINDRCAGSAFFYNSKDNNVLNPSKLVYDNIRSIAIGHVAGIDGGRPGSSVKIDYCSDLKTYFSNDNKLSVPIDSYVVAKKGEFTTLNTSELSIPLLLVSDEAGFYALLHLSRSESELGNIHNIISSISELSLAASCNFVDLRAHIIDSHFVPLCGRNSNEFDIVANVSKILTDNGINPSKIKIQKSQLSTFSSYGSELLGIKSLNHYRG